jgi:hypothetical protein
VATVAFQVFENFSGNSISVDVYSSIAMSPDNFVHKQLSLAEFELPKGGTYAFDLAFDVATPLEALQIRLSTKQGAIEGSLLLREAVINRV